MIRIYVLFAICSDCAVLPGVNGCCFINNSWANQSFALVLISDLLCAFSRNRGTQLNSILIDLHVCSTASSTIFFYLAFVEVTKRAARKQEQCRLVHLFSMTKPRSLSLFPHLSQSRGSQLGVCQPVWGDHVSCMFNSGYLQAVTNTSCSFPYRVLVSYVIKQTTDRIFYWSMVLYRVDLSRIVLHEKRLCRQIVMQQEEGYTMLSCDVIKCRLITTLRRYRCGMLLWCRIVCVCLCCVLSRIVLSRGDCWNSILAVVFCCFVPLRLWSFSSYPCVLCHFVCFAPHCCRKVGDSPLATPRQEWRLCHTGWRSTRTTGIRKE